MNFYQIKKKKARSLEEVNKRFASVNRTKGLCLLTILFLILRFYSWSLNIRKNALKVAWISRTISKVDPFIAKIQWNSVFLSKMTCKVLLLVWERSNFNLPTKSLKYPPNHDSKQMNKKKQDHGGV